MYCHYCNFENPETAKFCRECGENIYIKSEVEKVSFIEKVDTYLDKFVPEAIKKEEKPKTKNTPVKIQKQDLYRKVDKTCTNINNLIGLVACLVNLFVLPGLGCFMKGHIPVGVGFMAFYVIWIVLAAALFVSTWGFGIIFILPIDIGIRIVLALPYYFWQLEEVEA